MSSLVNYLKSWLYTPEKIHETTMTVPHVINYLVSIDELNSVKLKPIKTIIPAPARNMPRMNKFKLHMLNKAQLHAILNVKLKPVKLSTKPTTYLPRHPVLQELLSKHLIK